jgi:hypothetical protein
MSAFVNLTHILVFSTLLAYIGILQTKMPAFMYPIILGLGGFIILYHIYKALFKQDAWVNYIHIFLVGPVMVYIGLYKKATPIKIFEIVLMLAFASFGYHAYQFINGFNDKM